MNLLTLKRPSSERGASRALLAMTNSWSLAPSTLFNCRSRTRSGTGDNRLLSSSICTRSSFTLYSARMAVFSKESTLSKFMKPLSILCSSTVWILLGIPTIIFILYYKKWFSLVKWSYKPLCCVEGQSWAVCVSFSGERLPEKVLHTFYYFILYCTFIIIYFNKIFQLINRITRLVKRMY